jgi:flagellar biosynthesis/type III secretory pathway M-ring protein FliF/YscJ
MDIFKAQLDRIKQQLAGLTATQKMLVGSLVAVMVMTLLYWGRYAGNAEMVPVLDQSLSDDEIGRIDMSLEAKGIPHSVVAGKVMVPTDRKMEIVADLMYEQAMPRDSKSAFEEMSAKLNPFSSDTERDAWYNQATQETLSEIIRRFPNVSDAHVIINAKNERRIENSIPPSATIFITTRGENAGKQLVVAAADGVAGAVSGLTRGRISVIVNGISHHLSDDTDGFAPSDLMEAKQKVEASYEQKIREQFAYIQGLTVTVTCAVENTTTSQLTTKYDAATTVVKPAEEKTHTEETTTSAGTSADTAVGANIGASISPVNSGGGTSTTTEENENKNVVFPSSSVTNTQTPAGKDTVESAAVGVPRSFIVGIYKEQNPNAKDPDDGTLQGVADAEVARIKASVKNCIGLKVDDSLSVDIYPDPTPVLAMATMASAPSQSLTTVTGHAKEISVGVLAVVSLLMMFSMVRKSAPPPVVVAPEVEESPEVLTTAEGVAGEVGGGGTTLDGVELDEDAVRNQQMLEQVTTMVKENPEAAANLVKRWLNRS